MMKAAAIIRIMFYAGLTLIVIASFMEWGLNSGLAMWGAALIAPHLAIFFISLFIFVSQARFDSF